MGNAPICQACSTDKGVRVQGNVQDADKIPDYYGCNNGVNKDPEGLVSLKRIQLREQGTCYKKIMWKYWVSFTIWNWLIAAEIQDGCVLRCCWLGNLGLSKVAHRMFWCVYKI